MALQVCCAQRRGLGHRDIIKQRAISTKIAFKPMRTEDISYREYSGSKLGRGEGVEKGKVAEGQAESKRL